MTTISYISRFTIIWLMTKASNKIDSFCLWAEFMTDDEKELMLNWLIPTFAEHDVSVKIYHKLTK